MAKRIYNHEIAESFFTSTEYVEDLAYSKNHEEFYLWKGGWYDQLEQHELRKRVWDFIRAKYPNSNITKGLIDDVIFQISLGCFKIFDDEDTEYICFKDVLLNMRTFEPEPHNRDKFIMFNLPFEYHNLDPTIENFENFLRTSFVDKEHQDKPDEEIILLVQEMMGNFLIPNMKASAAFFLVGQGSNGKSILSEVIGDLFGKKFRSAMSLQTLTTRVFSLFHLIGKRVNISNEEESKYMQADVFKALVTGEVMSGEKKFGGQFEFNNTAKLLFASNRLPIFDGLNHGLRRRIKIIPFFRIFADSEQDTELGEKIRKEIQGVVLWMIAGAKRLVENRYTFTMPKVSRIALEELTHEISSAIAFINDCYKISEEASVRTNELYNEYKYWCNENGRKPLSKQNLIKDIESNVPGLKNRVKRVDGNNIRGYNLYKITDEYRSAEDSFILAEQEQEQEIDVNKLDL